MTDFRRKIEEAESFKGQKEELLIYLLFKACDLLGIPRTTEVTVVLKQLRDRGLLTEEEYDQTVKVLDRARERAAEATGNP